MINKYAPIVFTLLALLIASNTVAQDNITGFVIDAITKNPIEGVEVWDDNKHSKGDITNTNGSFKLSDLRGNIKLIFEKEGYKIQSLYVATPSTITVALVPENEPVVELILTIQDNTNKRFLSELNIVFKNIVGFDQKQVDEKLIIKIPLSLVENRNNKISINVQKDCYIPLEESLIFTQDEKRNQSKYVEVSLTRIEKPTPKALLLIPSLYQFKTNRKVMPWVLLGTQTASIAGVLIADKQYSTAYRNMQINVNNSSKYLSYQKEAADWKRTRNILIGTSIVVYAANIIDGFMYKEPDKLICHQWRIKPSSENMSFGLALTYNF